MPFKRFKNEKEKKRARQAWIRQETARLCDPMDFAHGTPYCTAVPRVECIEYQTPFGTMVDMKDASLCSEEDVFITATSNGMWCKTDSIDHVIDLVQMVQHQHGNIKFCIRLDRCDEAKLNKARTTGYVVRRTLNHEY